MDELEHLIESAPSPPQCFDNLQVDFCPPKGESGKYYSYYSEFLHALDAALNRLGLQQYEVSIRGEEIDHPYSCLLDSMEAIVEVFLPNSSDCLPSEAHPVRDARSVALDILFLELGATLVEEYGSANYYMDSDAHTEISKIKNRLLGNLFNGLTNHVPSDILDRC